MTRRRKILLGLLVVSGRCSVARVMRDVGAAFFFFSWRSPIVFLFDSQEDTMKNRLAFGTMVLIASMLACSFPVDPDYILPEKTNLTKITNVVVSPLSGPGDFTLKVTYESIFSGNQLPGDVYCRYITPDGATFLIDQIVVYREHIGSSKVQTLTSSLPFSVRKEEGVVKPGVYMANCIDESGGVWVETPFTVIGAAMEIPAVAIEPPVTRLISGTIIYDEATEQLSPHKNPTGYFPSQHHKWCAITLNIGIDTAGNISGTCAAEGHDIASGLYGDWNGSATIEGTITGMAVPGGSFIFREELIEKNMPGDPTWGSTRKVIFIGTGSFVSPTRATGTAKISTECSTVYTSSTLCGDDYSASDSFTGTINWEFNGTASP